MKVPFTRCQVTTLFADISFVPDFSSSVSYQLTLIWLLEGLWVATLGKDR